MKRHERKKLLIYIHVAVPWKPPYAEKLVNFDTGRPEMIEFERRVLNLCRYDCVYCMVNLD